MHVMYVAEEYRRIYVSGGYVGPNFGWLTLLSRLASNSVVSSSAVVLFWVFVWRSVHKPVPLRK